MNPNLNKALAGVTATIQTHEEIVTEAAALFAAGKLAQEDLDQAIRERNAALSRRAALQAAVQAAEARDEEAEKQAESAARKAAARKANELQNARLKQIAVVVDAANTLNTALARLSDLHSQLDSAMHFAGINHDTRQAFVRLNDLAVEVLNLHTVNGIKKDADHYDERLRALLERVK